MADDRPTGPAEWIELLASNAQRLREAGVKSLRVGEMEVAFAPYVPEIDLGDSAEDSDVLDPLDDPWTYARPGGRVPGFPDRSEQ